MKKILKLSRRNPRGIGFRPTSCGLHQQDADATFPQDNKRQIKK
jgi:hypothetical protein